MSDACLSYNRTGAIPSNLVRMEGPMGYQRFVIVSHLRSGTHMLRTSLESHPAIICQSEVFNSDNRRLPYSLTTPAREILDAWVYRPLPIDVQAAGFVLQAYHPWGLALVPEIRQNPEWGDLWTILAAMPDLRVIHLKRRNLLRRHLSHVTARASGGWHAWDRVAVHRVTHLGSPPPPDQIGRRPALGDPVSLDPGILEADFRDVARAHRFADHTLGHQPKIDVIYEELCHDYELTCNRLQEFLGAVPVIPLAPAVGKLEQRSLAEAIANYPELKHHFAGTEWAGFFDE